MKTTLGLIEGFDELFRVNYSAYEDPSTTLFPLTMLKAAVSLSSLGYNGQRDVAIVAANILKTLSVEDYEAFTAAYEIPGIVRDLLLTDNPWPVFESVAIDITDLAPADAAAYRRRKRLEVDRFAEEAALKLVTGGTRKIMTYQAKAEEALRYLAHVEDDAEFEGDPEDYPLLNGEVGVTGNNMLEVAEVINGRRQIWTTAAAELEGATMLAKSLIANPATDIADIPGIVETSNAACNTAVQNAILAVIAMDS